MSALNASLHPRRNSGARFLFGGVAKLRKEEAEPVCEQKQEGERQAQLGFNPVLPNVSCLKEQLHSNAMLSPSTRLIVLTSNDDPIVRSTAMRGGAFAFFLKPASNEKFLAEIESAASRTGVVVAAAAIEALADLGLEYPDVGEDKLKELAAAKKKLLSN